jgi:hypothetical protein
VRASSAGGLLRAPTSIGAASALSSAKRAGVPLLQGSIGRSC